jgi:hypothetical protein
MNQRNTPREHRLKRKIKVWINPALNAISTALLRADLREKGTIRKQGGRVSTPVKSEGRGRVNHISVTAAYSLYDPGRETPNTSTV